jgi:release factor glutamine methyltransferase
VLAARARLEQAGLTSDEAALDARLLAQYVLGWDAARFFISQTDPAPQPFADAYEPVVARRSRREPLAYITGVREFWNLQFEVTPAVLIPRPETELLVAAVLERWPAGSERRVADVCTGSGCIAVALVHERRGSSILATDISADALAVARRNAVRHQVEARVECRRMDLLTEAEGEFDLITANPPYVPEADRRSLQPEVGDYEPSVALFAGSDGSDVIARLAGQVSLRLKPGGFFFFEFGAGQEPRIREIVAGNATLRLVDVKCDLQGIPRTAVVRRNGGG